MGKLGKKKIADPEVNKQKSTGYSDEENPKNGAIKFDDDKFKTYKDERDRRESSSKKQIASSATARATTQEDDRKSDESDDMPLNGNKACCSSAPPQKKLKKFSKSKGKVPATEKEHTKQTAAKCDKSAQKKEPDEAHGREAEFEVEAIVGHKTKRGESFFMVHWKGYGREEDSWEPEADLNCDDLIEEYRRKESGKGTAVIKKGPAGAKAGRGRKLTKTIDSDPEKEWAVERILDFVDDEHGGLYRIRWKGFGAKEDTWEPESNLSCEGLIEKFKKTLEAHRNVDVKNLRESPKKTKRLVNETTPRSAFHSRIERSSKRAAAKNRVFYGEE